MAKVSIVIPTRSRAHLLHYALKSAVEQTYDDLEIVVCDNHSKDNTREVVKSFDNKNIIYLQTGRDLPMPDNWEYALSNASGEYITYLADDSYLFPGSIEAAMRMLDRFNLKVAVWKACAYFATDWLEPARRNLLYIPKVTTDSRVLPSKVNLQKLYSFDGQMHALIPKFLNSLCHESIIKEIINIQKRLFLPPCPDYTAAASILLNTKEYLLIDQTLYIDGVTTASIGATSEFLGESSQNYLKEFQVILEDAAFLGIPTSTNSIAKSLDNVRYFYPDTCPEINNKALVCSIIDRLIKMENNGAYIHHYWKVFDEYLSIQSLEIRTAALVQKRLSKLKWPIAKTLRFSPRLTRLKKAVGNIYILRGSDWQFSNIEESARAAMRIVGKVS